MRTWRALVIGPTPPPIGGDTISTQRLLASRYWKEFGIGPVHLNTSAGGPVRIGERLGLRDILRGARILVHVFSRLSRIDVVLLWANSRFLCTIGVPIIAMGRLARRPVVVKIFGAFLAERLRTLRGPWRRVVIGALGNAAFVFPQTESMTDELVQELGLPRERVICLPNFLPDAALEGTHRGRRFGGKCIFIGQIKREKGVFDIMEALAGRRDFTCDLYGPVLDRDRAEFLEGIDGTPNIHYRGVAPPGDVQRIVGEYDLLLLPTYHIGEGYPAVILEAFAAGVPVVATGWKSIPDLVADGERGIIVPVRSPGAIREALQRIGRDEALYESMSRNAFEYARRYSERIVVRGILLERVRGLLDGSGRRA
ncbi:MAG TPA: glycosyltransferase [Patescibacteria group bacterium]|nr:glycosyltransferase [Patescibacteria group bacterium]